MHNFSAFCSDCWGHLDCTYRNLCIIPGDPFYCCCYCWTFSFYWGHSFWRFDFSPRCSSLPLIVKSDMILGWRPNFTFPTRCKSGTASERWMFKYWSHISASKLCRIPVVFQWKHLTCACLNQRFISVCLDGEKPGFPSNFWWTFQFRNIQLTVHLGWNKLTVLCRVSLAVWNIFIENQVWCWNHEEGLT